MPRALTRAGGLGEREEGPGGQRLPSDSSCPRSSSPRKSPQRNQMHAPLALLSAGGGRSPPAQALASQYTFNVGLICRVMLVCNGDKDGQFTG
eukprot:3449305-Rhodomonas_salina.3